VVSAIISVVIGISVLLIDGYLSMGGNDLMIGAFDSSSPRIFYKMPGF